VWQAPALPAEVLAEYHAIPAATPNYTIDDHQHLASGHTRDLFEIFRREVLALDPRVSENFLKLYVAYKAETNFVDVIPQAQGMHLTLNVRFDLINDPKGVCTDVSSLGRWGNRDVELRVKDAADIPYAVGLVRQALEHQLDNRDDA
jgi:predicted transport protein